MQSTTDKHTFKVSFSKDFLPIQGDYQRLREVFTNLLGNAIKYSPDGGTISVGGKLGAYGTVKLYVRDEGIGIPPSDIERVFERFHRVDNRLARQTPGTGLGLFLVKSVVEAHNGRVWVESSPGEGSTFWVELPVGGDYLGEAD